MAQQVKNTHSARDAGDLGLIPESGRSPGGDHGNPLQYSCLENPMDRGALWATVHWVTELDMTEATDSRNQCTKMDWNLIQRTIISITVGRNTLEEME